MIRVLLADDENLIRSALAQMLDLEDDIEVVAEAADGAEALAAARRTAPDVAVLDLQMPDVDGITLAEQLSRELPDCRCMIVTSSRAIWARVSSPITSTAEGFCAMTS